VENEEIDINWSRKIGWRDKINRRCFGFDSSLPKVANLSAFVEKLKNEVEKKEEELKVLLGMSRKVFLLLKEVEIPVELRWMIVERTSTLQNAGKMEKWKAIEWESEITNLNEIDNFLDRLELLETTVLLQQEKKSNENVAT